MAGNVKKKQNVELLIISDQNEVNYYGYCKVTINTVSKLIFVEPYDESIKMIQASFDWKFINDVNILFGKSPDNTIQFALIFKTPSTTKKIMDVIVKYHPQKASNQKVLFVDDILVPAVLEKRDTKIKEIFLKYIQFCYDKKKEKYLKIINGNNKGDESNSAKNPEIRHRNSRKRSLHHFDENEATMPIQKRSKVKHQKEQTKKIKSYNFKLLKYKKLDEIKEKLYIFVDGQRHTGHSYRWDNTIQKYKCHKCRYKKYFSTAILKKDDEGKEFCEVGIHTCHSRKFIRIQNHEKRRKIYKPDYKIIDGYICGKLKQRLIIFDPTNKQLCYEYYPKGRKFCCAGCMLAEDKKIAAQLYYYGTEEEYVEIYSDNHVCEMRPYNPEKFISKQKIVQKCDYKFKKEIRQGKERETLIVFVSGNKELCYKYAKSCTSYTCLDCRKKNHSVTAVLVRNGIEEEYIRLSPNQHICEPQVYESNKNDKNKEIIIDSSKFKILKQDKYTLLFVMDKKDKTLGYKYYRSDSSWRYYCDGCYQKSDKKENFVNLKSKENGEKYLTARAEQKHLCKPVKFDVIADEVNMIEAKNYIFVEIINKRNTKSKELIIFTSETKEFCYAYLYITRNELFKCKACLEKKKDSSAKICKNLNGNEYVRLGAVKHVCKPKKYLILKSSITKFLKYDDFPRNQRAENSKEKNQSAIKDESKIVKLPNFKLMPNKNGVKDSLLIITCPNDKTLFYQYNYQKSSDNYICFKCQKIKKICVTAKLCKDITGIQFITLGINDHICEPMKIMEKEKLTNYLMFDRDDETKPTKLVVFTSPERSHCYEYFQPKGRIKFSCRKCLKLRVSRFAEVVKDEDGNEYIELDEKEHLCDPVIFEPSKYEQNPIIPDSQFLIFPNSNGAQNKRLIIFDSDNYDFGYDCNKGDSYKCYGCEVKNHSFTTKLSTAKNGEKCLEILQNGHVCKSKNLFKEKRIFNSSNYKIIDDENGNKMIILNHPMEKKLCYKFVYDNDYHAFCCIQCRKEKNKITAAKICKTNIGEEVVVLAYNHNCEPFRQ